MEEWKLPEAFEERMRRLLGMEFDQFYVSYAEDNYQGLRINLLKKGLDKEHNTYLQSVCQTPVPWAENGYYYSGDVRPGKHPYHEMGVYYIQEPSAMSAAAVLSPEPGMRVLDMCAAPGGKTTQLAAILDGQGLLVSNEIHPARAKILSTNVERMGIANAVVTNEDSSALRRHFGCFFHAILVDSPCSGEGMFRKNPAAMEEWSKENVSLCASRSREILDNAAEMLLPGGTMVYSTCTFAPEENEQTIADFLQSHPEFELVQKAMPQFSEGRSDWLTKAQQENSILSHEIGKTMRLWPHRLHGEGHFVACLKKAGTLPEYEVDASAGLGRKPVKSSLDKEKQKALEELLHSSLAKETADWIERGKLVTFGDQLYRMPEEEINLKGLRVLRAGLHIGEFKKNRIEPSHALALALGGADATCVVSLDLEDARTNAFFRGEALYVEPEQIRGSNKGWCLVCVDHMSAGWGKLANGQVKNHYPKGLRREL